MLGKIDCHGFSTTEADTRTNHDQFLIADLNKSLQVHLTTLNIANQSRVFGHSQGKLFVVADGAGITNAAERASQLAVDTVSMYLLNTMPWLLRLDAEREDDFVDDLTAAIEASQEAIQREAGVIEAHRGMGTTLTMAYVVWPKMYVVHVGDSRCYLLRDGTLIQLTRDHTQAATLVDEGIIEADEVEDHPWSNVLSNVVGGNSEKLRPDVHRANLLIGDSILLCTDGLHKHVADVAIGEALDGHDSAETTTNSLVEMARVNGSPDSATAVVARFGGRGGARAETQASETIGADAIAREPGAVKEATGTSAVETVASGLKKRPKQVQPIQVVAAELQINDLSASRIRRFQ